VEDCNIHGHPVREELPPGPYEAVQEWYPKNDELFQQDRNCERFLMTFNPGGYLRRMR
jgi:cephalosporin hydroxylase